MIIVSGIIAEIITYTLYKDKLVMRNDSILGHRITRLVARLLTFGGVWMLAGSWVRHPVDEGLYNNTEYFGLAYFANKDRF